MVRTYHMHLISMNWPLKKCLIAYVYECTMSGFGHWNPLWVSLGGLEEFRKALLRFWWAISPQVHNHCTGGPGKWWATTGGPGERHWNRGWAEAVKATCNGHQCYTGAMGALLLGHHDPAQNFEQRQKDSAQWDFNLTSEYLFFYHCQHICTLYGTATSMVNTSSCDKSDAVFNSHVLNTWDNKLLLLHH